MRRDDKSILWDCLKDQKFMAGNYVGMAGETANSKLLADVLQICQDELRANFNIFNVMSQNGWYQTQAASMQQIAQEQGRAEQLQNQM